MKYFMRGFNELSSLGHVTQLVVSLIADLGVVSLIPTRSHTFVEIDMKYFLHLFSSFHLASVTSESMCTKYWLTTA